jgi:hypothetical protein
MKKIALSMILGLGMFTSAASAGNGLEHGQPCKTTAACESGLTCRLPEAVTSGGQTFCLPELPPEAPEELPPPVGSFFVPETDPDNTYTCPGPDHWTGGKLSEY